jgi:hypothetical protein
MLGRVVEMKNNDIVFDLWVDKKKTQFTLPKSTAFLKECVVEDDSYLPGTVSATKVDAGGAGNCFYYTIFAALKAANVTFLGNTKEECNEILRKYVAEKIKAKEIIQHFSTLDAHTKAQSLNVLSHELQKILTSSSPQQEQEMREAIKTPGVYVSQFEVEIVKQLLAENDIVLEIRIDGPEKIHVFPLPSRILLVNENDHYRWYQQRQHVSGGGTRRKRK